MIFADLDLSHQGGIAPVLRPYFDQITIENADEWLMRYRYADQTFTEGFEVLWNDDYDDLIRFEQRKLFLFLNGTALYRVSSIDSIVLKACVRHNSEMFVKTCRGFDHDLMDVWANYEWTSPAPFLLGTLTEIEIFVSWFGNDIKNVDESLEGIKWPLVRSLYVVVSLPKEGMEVDVDAIQDRIRARFPECMNMVFATSKRDQVACFQVDLFLVKVQ